MRVIVLFLAIAVLLALGRGMDGPLATAGVVYTWEVDDNGLSCLTPPAGASHMTIADALAVAGPGENIFVCDGTYAEDNLQLMEDNVGLFGPAFTPEDDGIARIIRAPSPASGQMLYVRGDGDRVSGFEFDASPVMTADGVAINSRANHGDVH